MIRLVNGSVRALLLGNYGDVCTITSTTIIIIIIIIIITIIIT